MLFPTETSIYYSPLKLQSTVPYRSVCLLFPTQLTKNTSSYCSSQRNHLIVLQKKTLRHSVFKRSMFPTKTSLYSFLQRLPPTGLTQASYRNCSTLLKKDFFLILPQRLRTTIFHRGSTLFLPTETSITLFSQRLRSSCRLTVPQKEFGILLFRKTSDNCSPKTQYTEFFLWNRTKIEISVRTENVVYRFRFTIPHIELFLLFSRKSFRQKFL